MEYQIKFSYQANLDYIDAIQYYFENSKKVAENFDENLGEVLKMIQTSPEIFRKFEGAPNFRRIHILKFKQQIVYQIFKEEKVILIIAIIHHSTNPNRLIRRLK